METLVEKIHREIDEAADRLVNPTTPGGKEEIDFLESIGFKNCENVESYRPVYDNDVRKHAKYYKTVSPLYKFLTEEMLDSICKKWGLVYAGVDKYVGSIPKKNVEDMANYLILNKDKEVMRSYRVNVAYDHIPGERNTYLITANNEAQALEQARSKVDSIRQWYTKYAKYNIVLLGSKYGFHIAADPSLFDLTNTVREGIRIVDKPKNPDPIVFVYVKGGILVITKWGAEANDPELTIPELN
jgi:hypothetical protein